MNRLSREDTNAAYAQCMAGLKIVESQVSILASKKIFRIMEEGE
jgi:hypothetical protein